MARADWALNDQVTLTGLWIPEFRPTTLLFAVPAGLARDDRRWDAAQFAVKLDRSGGRIDGSVSYFDGRDPIFDIAIDRSGAARRYNRVRVLGADVATTAGPYGFRLEAAYTDTAFDPARNPWVRRPDVWVVLGADRTFGSVYVNVQASLRRVLAAAAAPPAALAVVRRQIDALRFQQDPTQWGLTLNVRKSWDDGRWSAEVSGVQYLEQQQGALRLDLKRQIGPKLTLQLRAQQFYGARGSYFAVVRPASSIGLEARLAV